MTEVILTSLGVKSIGLVAMWYFHFHCGCCVGGHFLITMIFIFQMLDLLSKTDGGWGGGWHGHRHSSGHGGREGGYECNEDRVDVDTEGFELSFHNKKVAFDSKTKSIGIGCFHLRTGGGKRGSVCRGGRPSWRFVIVVFMLCYCCCCMFCEEEQLWYVTGLCWGWCRSWEGGVKSIFWSQNGAI